MLLKSKSVELTKVREQLAAEAQNITDQYDIQIYLTNICGEAQKSVSGQQLSQSLLLSH